MAVTPVNHPPTPVQEGVGSPVVPADDPCEKIKAEFGIETGSHKENTSGSTKKSNRDYQSHHVLQDAATNSIIPRAQALAIMLADSHSGTEHGVITASQNSRMSNKAGGGGPTPGTTFGAVKKQARDDLVNGLKGKRKSKLTDKPMTQEEAEKAADCILKEAEEKVKKEAEKNGETVDDSTPVNQPGGCLAADALLRLADGRLVRVDRLEPGDSVATLSGARAIVRIERCRHELVELGLGTEVIRLASFHPVVDAEGRAVRADLCRVGDRLATATGVRVLRSIRVIERSTPVFRVGLRAPAVALLGRVGLHSILPEAGPPIVASEPVVDFDQEHEHARPAP